MNTGDSNGLRRTTSSKASLIQDTTRPNRQLANMRKSPANQMHFSIRQRVVSLGHNSYESNASTTRRRVSWPTSSLQRVTNILSPPNEMHFSIPQRIVSHGHDSYESNESTTRTRVSWHTACWKYFKSP